MAFDIETFLVVFGALLVWARCCIALVRAFLIHHAEKRQYWAAGWWVLCLAVLLMGCLMLADLIGMGAAAVCSVAVCAVSFSFAGLAMRFVHDRWAVETLGDEASSRDRCARAARACDLTRREEEVLVLMLEGWGVAQIADELVVSVNTVKTHVRNLYRKLGVTRRQDLAARVVAAGEDSTSCPATRGA